jgi:hypothetical protein
MGDQLTMPRNNNFKIWAAGAILVGGLLLTGFTNAPGAISDFAQARFTNESSVVEESSTAPVTVEAVAGTDVSRVTLSEQAAQRLQVQTAPVAAQTVNGADRLTVPFAAVLYDTSGGTWVYTNPQPLVFVRAPIVVDHIDGDTAVLSQGPAAGTKVATVGTAELSGSEKDIGSLGE